MFGDCFTNRPAASGTPFPEIKASIDWQYAIAAARKVMRYCANSSLAAACAPPRLAIPRLAIGVGAGAAEQISQARIAGNLVQLSKVAVSRQSRRDCLAAWLSRVGRRRAVRGGRVAAVRGAVAAGEEDDGGGRRQADARKVRAF